MINFLNYICTETNDLPPALDTNVLPLPSQEESRTEISASPQSVQLMLEIQTASPLPLLKSPCPTLNQSPPSDQSTPAHAQASPLPDQSTYPHDQPPPPHVENSALQEEPVQSTWESRLEAIKTMREERMKKFMTDANNNLLWRPFLEDEWLQFSLLVDGLVFDLKRMKMPTLSSYYTLAKTPEEE